MLQVFFLFYSCFFVLPWPTTRFAPIEKFYGHCKNYGKQLYHAVVVVKSVTLLKIGKINATVRHCDLT
jgi:hypothetical protein